MVRSDSPTGQTETAEEYLVFMKHWQQKHRRPDEEPSDIPSGEPKGAGAGFGFRRGWLLPGQDLSVPSVPPSAPSVPPDAEGGAEEKAEEGAGGSTLSWSVAEEPPPRGSEAFERNKNRHAAPIGWEADEGQGRGSVMNILGGGRT